MGIFYFLFRDKILLTFLTFLYTHFIFLSYQVYSLHSRAMLKHCHLTICSVFCSHMSSKNIKVFFFLLSGPQLENWPAENALRRVNILKEAHIVLLSSYLAPTSPLPPQLSQHLPYLSLSFYSVTACQCNKQAGGRRGVEWSQIRRQQKSLGLFRYILLTMLSK